MDVPSIVVIAGLVGALLGGLVVALVPRRRARRLTARGRLGCSLRVISGEVEGLADTWHHGAADLDGAVIHVRRGLPGGRGVRPSSVPVSLTVEAVQGRRRPDMREWWGLEPDCVVLAVRSRGAHIEGAVLAPQAAWARSQVEA